MSVSESDSVKQCIVYSDGDSVKNLRVFHDGKLFFKARHTGGTEMSDDLVKRLREPLWGDSVNPEEDAYDPVRLEAADRIEALEEALRQITQFKLQAEDFGVTSNFATAVAIASAALGSAPSGDGEGK